MTASLLPSSTDRRSQPSKSLTRLDPAGRQSVSECKLASREKNARRPEPLHKRPSRPRARPPPPHVHPPPPPPPGPPPPAPLRTLHSQPSSLMTTASEITPATWTTFTRPPDCSYTS